MARHLDDAETRYDVIKFGSSAINKQIDDFLPTLFPFQRLFLGSILR